jgi:translation elongation factor EF-1alpha
MKNSEAAAVVLRFEKPIVCEVYKKDTALGRFSMRQGKRLIGAGKIIEI